MKDLKVVFMGTPDFSVPVLKGLIENCNVIGVVTQPDKETGRHKELIFSPVKKVAIENNIKVLQPIKIRNEYQDVLDLNPDIIVTCAYGQIIPSEILDYPKYKCINIHASVLPKLRGGAPIQRAIMNGYKKTGITIMFMDVKMDAGAIIKTSEIEIKDDENYASLHNRLSKLGSELLIDTLPSIISGDINPIGQSEREVTYGFNISKEDEKIDFTKRKIDIYNQIRALDGFSGAYCIFQGKRLKVWTSIVSDNHFSNLIDGEITNIYKEGIGVKVSDGEIILTSVQLEGKNRMSAKDFANGKDIVGKVLE